MSLYGQLPPTAAEYVSGFPSKSRTRYLIGRLHAWLEMKQIDVSELNTDLVDRFIHLPWTRRLTDSTKFHYRKQLDRYVGRCGDCGHAQRSQTSVPFEPLLLPQTARQFVQELEATLSPGTCNCYRTALRRWFRWAKSKGIDTRELTRQDVVAFFNMLHHRGLAPETRGQYLAKLRRYLFYLADQDLLSNQPTTLIRLTDFPKRPSPLPRALRPDVDAELRARLTAAQDIRYRGLLLMRHTGLRVGELATLTFECVHEDHQEHCYLKVPLGKLKNERLVPLNDETLSLVRELQQQGRRGRRWLIENPRRKKPYGIARYQQLLRALQDGLATPDGLRITTHRLRHTFATELLNAGLSVVAIRQLLGHRSINMTLRYVSLTPNQLRQAYLVANTKARQRYGKIPEAPRTAGPLDDATSADTIADVVRRVKRDAATLPEKHKARARRATRQLKNLGILLNELGL